MRAMPIMLNNLHIAIAALLFTSSFASPALRRADTTTDSGLEPWVTVPVSGSPSTVTPHLTTISGVATTIDAAPASLTATATTTDSTTSTDASATSTPSDSGGGAFEICHNSDGVNSPICDLPNNNTVYIGEKYYVTWDTTYYTSVNSSNIVTANYANSTLSGQIAWDSPETLNAWGFVTWTPEASILQDEKSNNVTLFITNLLATPDKAAISRKGPDVVVTTKPYVPYAPPGPTKAPKGESLYIALPVVLGTLFFCVVGIAIWNRKERRIGLGNVMGRNRGYGVRKSGRERLGLKKGVRLQQELRVQALRADGEYRDHPVPLADVPRHARGGSEVVDLDSLAGSPTEERGSFGREGGR